MSTVALAFPWLVLAFLVFLVFFEKGLAYRVVERDPPRLDSEAFERVLAALADAQLHRGVAIDVLADGATFYEAQLEAIRSARRTVHLEQYIFRPDRVGRRFVDALVERARAGVKVRLTLDWIGSFATPDSLFDELRAAGGDVQWYQPPRWYTFKHFSNRTHRKLLVVDGRVGFTGGAGVGDEWLHGTKGGPPWRDTVFRVNGALAGGLQTCFVENWVESAGEVLVDPACFPPLHDDADGDAIGFVVVSAPEAGRSSRAHVVYQALIASARESIDLCTPYFLPDEPTLDAIVAACRRGVRVRLVTAGPHTDQRIARASARERYGELLACDAEVYEYQPAMLHTKGLVVDRAWSCFGSTNLDNRSFALNDEVFVVARDARLAGAILADLQRDVAASERVTLERWARRPLRERLVAPVARLFDRQS